jgi:hypothetical protein
MQAHTVCVFYLEIQILTVVTMLFCIALSAVFILSSGL